MGEIVASTIGDRKTVNGIWSTQNQKIVFIALLINRTGLRGAFCGIALNKTKYEPSPTRGHRLDGSRFPTLCSGSLESTAV